MVFCKSRGMVVLLMEFYIGKDADLYHLAISVSPMRGISRKDMISN